MRMNFAAILFLCAGTATANAQNEAPTVDVVVDRDVLDTLYERLSLTRGRVSHSKCYALTHSGMHAAIPMCDFYYEIPNLRVSAWSDVKRLSILQASLPSGTPRPRAIETAGRSSSRDR